MTDRIWLWGTEWMLRCVLGGGLLLLVGSVWLWSLREPARRRQVGLVALQAAIVVAVLSVLPAWWLWPGSERFVAWLPSDWLSAKESIEAVATSDDGQPDGFSVVESPIFGIAESSDEFVMSEPPFETEAELPALGYFPLQELSAAGVSRAHENSAAGMSNRWWPALWMVGVSSYACVVVLLIGRWITGLCVLSRRVRAAHPADADVTARVNWLWPQRRTAPRVLVSDQIAVPLCCGWRQPTVLLPTELCRHGDSPALRCVLAHELSHIARGDLWTVLWVGLAQPLYFFAPWFWWLKRQITLSQEFLADAAAAAQTDRVEEYASFLVKLSGQPVLADTTGVLGNPSDLFRRVTMLLKSESNFEAECPRRWSMLAAGLFLLSAVVLAGGGWQTRVSADDQKLENNVTASESTAAAEAEGETTKKPDADDKQEPKRARVRVITSDSGAPLVIQNPGEKKRVEVIVVEGDDGEVRATIAPPGAAASNPATPRRVQEIHERLATIAKKMAEQKGDGTANKEFQEQLEQLIAELRRQHGAPGTPPVAAWMATPRSTALGTYTVAINTQPPRLGAQINPVSPLLQDQLGIDAKVGMEIRGVMDGSAAAKAGIRENDVLVSLAGKDVPNDPTAFQKLVRELPSGKPLEAVVIRKGKRTEIHGIELPEAKEAPHEYTHRLAKPVPGISGAGAIGGGFGSAPKRVEVQSQSQSNKNEFRSNFQSGGLSISVQGSIDDGKHVVREINIEDNGETFRVKSLEAVPEKYRSQVESMLPRAATGKKETSATDVEQPTKSARISLFSRKVRNANDDAERDESKKTTKDKVQDKKQDQE